MTISRYETDNIVQDGKLLGTNSSILIIRQAIKSGEISVLERVTSSLERLDIIASQYYGDGRLWWIIAAASGIGWWLQIPPGTLLRIPISLEAVQDLIS
jgi:hypothetical protein